MFGNNISTDLDERFAYDAEQEARRADDDAEMEPPDESDRSCDCGDPDCSRPFGHPHGDGPE